jgi:hypothetical protein
MEASGSARRAGVLPAYDRAGLPVAESGLPRSQQLRYSLRGVALGALALAACTIAGLLIRAAVFGA